MGTIPVLFVRRTRFETCKGENTKETLYLRAIQDRTAKARNQHELLHVDCNSFRLEDTYQPHRIFKRVQKHYRTWVACRRYCRHGRQNLLFT